MAAAWAGAGGRQGVGHRGEEMSANEAATTGGVVGTERRKPGMRYSKIALRHVRQLQRQGDWLSGRAPRSHRGGHWFDPSIAHQFRAMNRTSSEPVRALTWGACA